MIVYNIPALVMVLIAGAAEIGVSFGLKLSKAIPLGMTLGAVLIVVDLLYRGKGGFRSIFKRSAADEQPVRLGLAKWYHHRLGGSVFWLPVWLYGAALLAFSVSMRMAQ